METGDGTVSAAKIRWGMPVLPIRCVGFMTCLWHPPAEMVSLLQGKYSQSLQPDRVKKGAPKIFGKNALAFYTYSGPHTGIREGIPAGKFGGQCFKHLGFTVLDE